MISRRRAIGLAVTALIGAMTPALAQKKNSTLVGQFDTDNDGTVDLAEAKTPCPMPGSDLEKRHGALIAAPALRVRAAR